jgi:DNA-directed RNA polymerase subunit F
LRPTDEKSAQKLFDDDRILCVVPMDIALEIDSLPFKMTRAMMCEVAFWAQNQPSYKSAETILKKINGEGVAAATIRLVADYIGKIVFDADAKEANKCYAQMCNTTYTRDKKGVLYIQTDGAALNTRIKDNNGSTWRENKLGMVFSSDNIKTTINKKGEKVSVIRKKEYTSYVGSVDEFKKYLFACAVRNGYGRYQNTVILSDGATWIRNMSEELFPDAVQILDLFHLCENTYEYAKAIFKNDETKYKRWAENLIERFKNSEISEALAMIKPYKNRKLSKSVVNLYTYVQNNITKIDYKFYKERGYYVGSGAIESGNKVVLQKRLKLAGMRWNERTAQYLLTLRAKIESGLWIESVVSRIASHDFLNDSGICVNTTL